MKVKEGTFENFEGEVGTIDAQSGRVTVMINIFGRSTPVELEYWQVENSVDVTLSATAIGPSATQFTRLRQTTAASTWQSN